MFPSKKIGNHELLVLIFCLIFLVEFIFFEIAFPCLTNKYPLTFAILSNIFSGIIAAITLLFFQERHYLHQLDKYYSDIAGKYTRVDMGQDNTSDEAMDYMKSKMLIYK